jgi:glutamate formiminotransferase/formiminotetrahydrofolate cyclodeaminase
MGLESYVGRYTLQLTEWNSRVFDRRGLDVVYVPGGGMSGISKRLPESERTRLKAILKNLIPEEAGVIVRTAAEGVSEEELIHIAVKSLGLDELGPFDPQQKIIEYKLRNAANEKLIRMNLREFANETASESPAPGGGSISAYVGAMGVALSNMVANLSAGKRGWEDQTVYFSNWAEKGQHIQAELLKIVDEDTAAFNAIMNAFGLPKGTDAEKQARTQAIEDATKYACEVPLRTMKLSFESLDMLAAMIEKGNQNSITDAGVGVLCAKTAVRGAYFNVLVNAKSLKDTVYAAKIIDEAKHILQSNHQRADELIAKVEAAIA